MNKNSWMCAVYRRMVQVCSFMLFIPSLAAAADNIILNFTGTVSTKPCVVNSSSIIVSMGDYFESDFERIGSVSKDVPFSISLTCPANRTVSASVTATVETEGSQSGTIRLTNMGHTGVASGIAIQLVDEESNVIKLMGESQTLFTTQQAGERQIRWFARYIRTGPISVGGANATATITFNYQ
ncbi:TPA: type 1 fimbrial protein [Serratia marcescens]|nr:type 1 fimbrial protein [Serratia marcescens]HEJ9049142.1 type 1 fimbrial protein [Serratia marcescens]